MAAYIPDGTPVDQLELSVFAESALDWACKHTAGHIRRTNDDELLALRGFTPKHLKEVRALLGHPSPGARR